MNQRIKKLRKALDLTQQEFADKIGMKRNTVANYETDRNEPSNSVISLICREFNVNEEWLRTGSGEMFRAAPVDALDALIAQYGLPHELRILAEKFMALKPDAQEVVINYVRDAAAAIAAAAPAAPQDQQADWEREADAFAEIARQQFLSEKLQESQASSAKKSGGAGGVA